MAVRARFSASAGVCVVRGFFFRERTLSPVLIWSGSHFWNRWLQRHGYQRLLRKNIPGLERDEDGDKLIPRATDVHDVAGAFHNKINPQLSSDITGRREKCRHYQRQVQSGKFRFCSLM
jgi:hypothetical protein